MPTRPKTISLAPAGCTGRTPQQQAADRFYHSTRWKKVRALVLAEQPLCADCPEDRPALATHVHHVQELLQRPDLALDRANLIGLCNEHHTTRHKAGGRHY